MAATVAADPKTAKPPPGEGGLRVCLASLAGTEPIVSCAYTTFLTDEERADMRRLTRERLQDAVCRVTVKIDRALVAPALEKHNHEFTAPPQPVTCTISAKESSFDIQGTFSPKVTFKDGKAIYATPGLADVTGVSKVLSWPVVQYVNYSPGIRRKMLAIINAYRERISAPAP